MYIFEKPLFLNSYCTHTHALINEIYNEYIFDTWKISPIPGTKLLSDNHLGFSQDFEADASFLLFQGFLKVLKKCGFGLTLDLFSLSLSRYIYIYIYIYSSVCTCLDQCESILTNKTLKYKNTSFCFFIFWLT